MNYIIIYMYTQDHWKRVSKYRNRTFSKEEATAIVKRLYTIKEEVENKNRLLTKDINDPEETEIRPGFTMPYEFDCIPESEEENLMEWRKTH